MSVETLPEKRAELLAGHYQKTFELTYDLWKERNTIFLALMGAVGIETLLMLGDPTTNSLLVRIVAKLVNITDPVLVNSLEPVMHFQA
jgi:hypothetical protein